MSTIYAQIAKNLGITEGQVHIKEYVDSQNTLLIGPNEIITRDCDGLSSGVPSFNTSPIIKVEKRAGAFIQGLNLKFKLSAISGGTAPQSGGYRRFKDAIGISMFKKIRFLQDQTLLYEVEPYAMYNMIECMNNGEELIHINKKIAKLDGGDDSTTTDCRNLRAKSEQIITVNLDEFFPLIQKPFPLFLFKDNTTLNIEFQMAESMDSLIETNYTTTTPTATLNYFKLRVTYVYPHIDVVNYVTQQWLSKGLEKTIVEPIPYTYTIGPTETTFDKTITQPYQRNVVLITFQVIDNSKEVNSVVAGNRFSGFAPITSFQLLNDQTSLTECKDPTTVEDFRDFILEDTYDCPNYNGLETENIFFISYSKDLGTQFSDYGGSLCGFRYFNETGPTLKLNMNAFGFTGKVIVNTFYVKKLRLFSSGPKKGLIEVVNN